MTPVPPEVKICGLRRRENVLLADGLGADYVGVVLSAGFSRSVSPEEASGLVEGVTATPVAVLVDEEPAGAQSRGEALGAGVLQLHGDESPDVLESLRSRGPWRLWKAVRVRSADDVRRALDTYSELADGLLLEGWKEGVVGGGGARLEGGGVRGVKESFPHGLRLIVAGGLTPDNVEDAVARFRPDVVDVSSGVEVERGRKDPALTRRFVEAVRRDAGSVPPDPAQPGPRGEQA